MVEQFVPEKHKRLMVHIRKTILKQKRLQKLKSEESDKVNYEINALFTKSPIQYC